MQLICATFIRLLFLENICSRLLRNQMIVMLISHFHNILNAPVVFEHIPLWEQSNKMDLDQVPSLW